MPRGVRIEYQGAVYADVAAYPWSSLAVFGSARSLPAGLVRARLFDAAGLPDESARSRKRFVERLRLKARELWASENELEGDESNFRRAVVCCRAGSTAKHRDLVRRILHVCWD